jgi:hypothetical protein
MPTTWYATPPELLTPAAVATPDRHHGSGPQAAGARWFAVGRSRDTDARTAGAAAARAALTGADPRLLIVFCWDGYDLEALSAGVREVSGAVPLIGCTTAGEIATDGPGDDGVVVTAIGGSGFSVATAAAEICDDDLRGASAEAAGCLERLESRANRVLLLLTDGLAGDQQEIVRGAYSVVGAEVPLVGGCAGDGLKMHATFQLHEGRVLRNAVVAAAIASDSPFGIGVDHGWRQVGKPLLVTSSEAHRVLTLDDQPALDVYLRHLHAPPQAWTDAAAFTAFAATHPLGLSRRSGQEVRFVAGADFTTRALICIARVPQGGLAWFMEGDEQSVLAACDTACEEALGALDGRPPLGLLAFDCVAPLAGFYSYGEIARTQGVSGFHNQTLVVLAVS